MRIKIIIAALIICQPLIAQIPTSFGFTLSKASGDDISFAKAKTYFIKEILDSPKEVIQFEFDRIASSTSGDLTSFIYKCQGKNKEGLILAFYGDYWNDAGDIYKGYIFKDLPKDKAIEFLSKVAENVEEQRNFLSKTSNSNVYIEYDDMTIVISKNMETKIQILWSGFDTDWENWAFTRTKRRIEKGLK
jgi:hypothetical protein